MLPIAALRPAFVAGARYVAPAAGEGVKMGVSVLAIYATIVGVPAAIAAAGWAVWKGAHAIVVRPVQHIVRRVNEEIELDIEERVTVRFNDRMNANNERVNAEIDLEVERRINSMIDDGELTRPAREAQPA
jgi:hypothetical protein